ncbi:TRM11 family SAM-dependent methyltransferase [Streptosporangium saharense]|uniref:TRM11 family SAM-dependent methyltransferase n=1 Tax=Streptosporangium saharense TaxID=1706840 RepID=UPI00332705BF
MTAASLVARCAHGLESALSAEILHRGLGVITHLGHREIHFRSRGPGAVAPRTADDVFLLAGRRPDPGTARRDVASLARLAVEADLDTLTELRRGHGGPAGVAGIEVSASFLGGRNFNRYDVEDAVGSVLARRLGVGYHSRRTGEAPPPGHTGWRVTLDGVWATLMLRIGERPLHRRCYKRRTVPGTLHPPLAAAMARMAGIRPGHTVLDPCCGAGTLLAEAGEQAPRAVLYGFDLALSAVRAARENTAGLGVVVGRADAGRLPLADGSVDRVLSNPPWGGQVTALGLLAASPSRWWAELRRVLAPDGTAVVLLPGLDELPLGLRHGLVPVHVQGVRVSGAQTFLVRLTAPTRRRRTRA